MKFPYQRCVIWLQEEAAKLTALGFKVKVQENDEPMHSFLLKIASSKIEAELVVWDTGATSIIVFSLSQNRFEIDRHDMVLGHEGFESDLDVFFKMLK